MTSELADDATDRVGQEESPHAGQADRPSQWTVRVLVDGVEHRFAGVDRVAIGASASCHVVVDDVPARPIHCEILLDGGWWLCARSPVRLAGQDVHGWVPVASADRFEIGSRSFVVLFQEEPKEQRNDGAGTVDARNAPAPDDSAAHRQEAPTRRRRRWPVRTRSAVLASCAAIALAAAGVAVIVGDGGDSATARAAASRRPSVEKPPAATPVVDERRAVEPPPVERPATLAPAAERSDPVHVAQAARQAAHALLGGDYRVALQRYRVVAAAGDATAALFVRALEQRVSASCRRTGRPPEECLR